MVQLDSQTRGLLSDYLRGELPIDDLRRKVARLAWALESDEVTQANPITAACSLFVAEYEAGHRDESELRELFAAVLNEITTYATSTSVKVNFPTARLPAQSRSLVGAGTSVPRHEMWQGRNVGLLVKGASDGTSPGFLC